jgi:signal transduction histidine kinase
MPEGGKLTLKTLLSQNTEGSPVAVAEIHDTGVGIPASDLKKIFDPFFTSKAEGQGTGLGLSICHGIIHDLGGTIEVNSTIQKGSCFRVSLPLHLSHLKTGS